MIWLLPPLMGVAAYLAVHHLWIWLGRRREPLYLWAAAWSVASLVYLVSHHLQVAAAQPEQAVLGGRLTLTGAIGFIFVVIALSHALAGCPQPRRLLGAVAAVNVVLLGAVWGTTLLVSDRAYVRTDLLGYQYGAPEPGPLMPLLVPYI